jgi:hypothetical protein
MALKVIKKLPSVLLMLIMVFNTGCATVATSVATQAGVQVIGEQYLISQKKPMIKCNVINVIKGNKMCRVSRTYLMRRV